MSCCLLGSFRERYLTDDYLSVQRAGLSRWYAEWDQLAVSGTCVVDSCFEQRMIFQLRQEDGMGSQPWACVGGAGFLL